MNFDNVFRHMKFYSLFSMQQTAKMFSLKIVKTKKCYLGFVRPLQVGRGGHRTPHLKASCAAWLWDYIETFLFTKINDQMVFCYLL